MYQNVPYIVLQQSHLIKSAAPTSLWLGPSLLARRYRVATVRRLQTVRLMITVFSSIRRTSPHHQVAELRCQLSYAPHYFYYFLPALGWSEHMCSVLYRQLLNSELTTQLTLSFCKQAIHTCGVLVSRLHCTGTANFLSGTLLNDLLLDLELISINGCNVRQHPHITLTDCLVAHFVSCGGFHRWQGRTLHL